MDYIQDSVKGSTLFVKEMVKGNSYMYVIFLLIVITPVADYFLSIPMVLAWGGLQFLVWALGFA